MRGTFLALAVATLVVAGWPTTTHAQKAESTNLIRGTVTTVGADSVTIKAHDQDMTFGVDSKTKVEAPGAGTKTRQAAAAGKAGANLTDVVRSGQAVEIRYHDMGNTLHAASIRTVASVGGGGEAKPSEMSSSGTVKSIAASTLTITGNSGGGATFTQSFTIDPSTKVIAKGAGTAAKAKGGKLSITDAVGAGDKVIVSYHEAGGALHASQVRVTVKGAGRTSH